MEMKSKFISTLQKVDALSKKLGLSNGVNWIRLAYINRHISYATYMQYNNLYGLKNILLHENADSKIVSKTKLRLANQLFEKVQRTSITVKPKTVVKLPKGTFRVQAYKKVINLTNRFGVNFSFKFTITKEYGYMFTESYKIIIDYAPNFQYACKNPHTFHILSSGDYKIVCWDSDIDNFKDANAIMLVWAKSYVKAMTADCNYFGMSNNNSLSRTSKRILPIGTFRIGKMINNKQKREKIENQFKTIYITQNVYNNIISLLGTKKPELGGMLGWKENQDVIDEFVFDKDAKVGSAEYSPNTDYLNKIIQYEWEKSGIYLAGFVHSHPYNFSSLSSADVEYATRILQAFDMEYLFMPIITSSYNYKTTFNPYIVYANGMVKKCKIVIINETIDNTDNISYSYDEINKLEFLNGIDLTKIEQHFNNMKELKLDGTDFIDKGTCQLEQNEIYARIEKSFDIDYLKTCTIIGIGCGGARGFYEDMARMGVGNFYIMDGDISTRSNIASQHGFISDIGLKKTETTKNRLLDINDKINVVAFDFMLDDNITDDWLEENIMAKIDKKKTVFCAFTDDFFAQARVASLGEKFNIPVLSAQHHENGYTSEIIYWYPNVSSYTIKEILCDRYTAYENGFINNVTSEGSPIFNTTRLNALCCKIAIGILVYGEDENNLYCKFIKHNSDHNLILIRQINLLDTNSEMKNLFINSNEMFFDDAIWINPKDIL